MVGEQTVCRAAGDAVEADITQRFEHLGIRTDAGHFVLVVRPVERGLEQPAVVELLEVVRDDANAPDAHVRGVRSEEHTSELQSLMRSSYAVFCLKTKTKYYQ